MKKDSKILVTGGSGFLGRHLVRALAKEGFTKVTSVGSRDYDLTWQEEVDKLFREEKPQIVFHLAGLVGGILANKERPADYFYQNLMMGTLMMQGAFTAGVEKFIAAGAGCGYPQGAPIPLREDSLWDGFPQKESAPYSLAKRMLTIQGQALFTQHGFKSVICIPGNIYGEWDNFNLNNSHVVPALIRKFIEARRAGSPRVEVWGSGKPTRDYVYAGDVASGMIRAATVYDRFELVNLSSGRETSVRELCDLVKKATGYAGEIAWDSSRPDGQPRRCFDISKARRDFGFEAQTSLESGLKITADWYDANLNSKELRL